MNTTDSEYFRLLNLILSQGRVKHNRTGIDTIGVFGAQARFPLSDGFPILTTKKVFFKAIVHELLWFISGSTNIKYLVDNDVHIWDEWAYKRFCKSIDETKTKLDAVITKALISQEQYIKNIKEYPDFAERHGELGEGTYGGMWRAFPISKWQEIRDTDGNLQAGEDLAHSSVDQIQKVIDKLKSNPDDRRMIVSAWHPYWVDHCALPPCHCLFHFNTEELTAQERFDAWRQDKNHNPYEVRPAIWSDVYVHRDCDKMGVPRRKINLLLYQRSCDTFLGVPFNISSYALLLAMVAHCTNMVAGDFIHTYGDLHIYKNHEEQVKLQLSREPKALPKLWLNPGQRDLFKFKYEDIKLENYDPHPTIKGEVAV